MSKVLDKTESLCPVCLSEINAKVIKEQGKVFITKKCSEHGYFKSEHAWEDPLLYKKLSGFCDLRPHNKVDHTLDVTSRCNMECPFCFGVNEVEEPSSEEIMEKVGRLNRGMVLIYGGEPTTRDDLADIIRSITEKDLKSNLLTNGIELNPTKTKRFEESGLDRVQLQFDSADDEINVKLRGRKLKKEKLSAIYSLNRTEINLTLFMVAFQENIQQIPNIVSLMANRVKNPMTLIISPTSPEINSDEYQVNYLGTEPIFKEIESCFGITKNDFIACTQFDMLISKLMKEIGIDRRSPSPCEATTYVYSRGDLRSLNEIINLKKLTNILRNNIMESDKLIDLKGLVKEIIKNKIIIEVKEIPFLMLNAFKIILNALKDQKRDRNPTDLFALVVNPSQDRYNYDKRFIDNCNLESLCDREYVSFCERNIRKAGPKEEEKLDESFLN